MNNCFRNAGVAVAAAAACIFAGCGGTYDAERAYWHLSKKYEAVIANPSAASPADFNAAAAGLKNIVEAYPHWGKTPELQYALGLMYAEKGDSEAAEKEWVKVYTDFPKSMETGARALFSIGRLYEQRKDIPGALRNYNEITERYQVTSTGLQVPLYIVQMHASAGNAEESAKAAEKALRSYGNLIDMNPYGKGVAAIHELMVSLLAFQNRLSEAPAILERFSAKNPAAEAAPTALYRAAIIYQNQLKSTDKAAALFRRIIADYPNTQLNGPAQMEMGVLALDQGNFDQARSEFDKAFKLKPENTSIRAMARLAMAAGYEKAGKWDEALQEYRQLQKEQPRSPEALQAPLLIARYYQAHGLDDKRREELNQAVLTYTAMINDKKEPAVPAAHEALTRALILQEKWNEAISALETLRARYPQNAQSADALFFIGLVYRDKLNDAAKARETFQKFVRQYPRHPQAPAVNAMLSREGNK